MQAQMALLKIFGRRKSYASHSLPLSEAEHNIHTAEDMFCKFLDNENGFYHSALVTEPWHSLKSQRNENVGQEVELFGTCMRKERECIRSTTLHHDTTLCSNEY